MTFGTRPYMSLSEPLFLTSFIFYFYVVLLFLKYLMCLDIMSDVSLLNQESLFIEYLKKVTRRNADLIPRLHGQHIKK